MRTNLLKWIGFICICCGLIFAFQREMPVFGASLEQDVMEVAADNSGFASAQSISVNTEVSGALQTSSTVNYYKFTLSQAGYVYMEFNHGYVDSDSDYWEFTIYNSAYEKIMGRTSKGKTLSTTYASVGLAAGTYYVKVNAYYWNSASYQFFVHYTTSGNWEKENNDTFETANAASADVTVNGGIQASNDIDFYKFEVLQDGMVYIDFNHDYVDNDSEYWNIKIYNKDFEELMSRWSKGKNISTTYGALGVGAGTYYVRISSYYWSDVSYNFILHTTPSASWEKEKNESYQTANSLTVNSVINGSIRESGDKDFYRFEIPQAGYVNLDFGHDYVDSGSTYWNIKMYNDSYEELISRSSDGKTINKTYSMMGIPAGTYYIEVSAYYWSDASYNLKVNYTSASNWETELNESFDTSNELSIETYMYGSIRESNDVDSYKVMVPRAGFIKIDFNHEFVNSDNTYWIIKIYDASFNELVSTSCGGTDSLSSSPCYVNAGVCYIKVSAYYWSSATYHFKVTYNFTNSTPSISAEVTGNQYVKLSWPTMSNASGYEIYRATGKNGKYTLLKKITSRSTRSYTDTKVSLGKTYFYKIRGYQTSGGEILYSGFSSKKSVKVALAKVNISKAKSPSAKRVQLTWKKVSGASGYEVYRANTKNGKYKKIGTVSSGKKVSFTDKKVSRKKTYYYKVRAYKKVSGKKYYGDYSSKKSVKVK